jgi:hypothetical protein
MSSLLPLCWVGYRNSLSFSEPVTFKDLISNTFKGLSTEPDTANPQ